MIKFFLLSVLISTTLFANKVVYLRYHEVPKRVLKGEIFSVTLRALSTVTNFKDIKYKLSNYSGIKPMNSSPYRVKKGRYYYETFYFLSTKDKARLPDITATLVAKTKYESTKLGGNNINVIALNPKKNFSGIIAKKFSIEKYKTTSYDDAHNIIILFAKAKRSNIKSMHFKNVYKQGIESVNPSLNDSKITYFIVIDKKIENFTFSYFNLKKNDFSLITIPIIVKEDKVTTQTDLNPQSQSKERLKISIAVAVSLLILLLILWKKKYVYLIVLVIPLAYIVYMSMPEKEICIKKGTKIRLLPVKNGTIFETTTVENQLLKEGFTDNFVKVQLKNERIGWVKNEDICHN